jgi:geranylgeranyl pyrophosphate synthase
LDAAPAPIVRSRGQVDALVGLAAPDMGRVDALILDRMQSDVPVIPLLAEHLVGAGGRRLRPLLTVAAARATGAARTTTTAATRRTTSATGAATAARATAAPGTTAGPRSAATT